MLKELVDSLTDLGRKTVTDEIIPCPQEPKSHYLVSTTTGKLERREALPALRDHKAADLETICFIARNQREAKQDIGEEIPVLWYNRDAIILLMDDNKRWDRVTMAIELSPQIQSLAKMGAQPGSYTQKNLIWLLRTMFKDCLSPNETLIDVIRKIKWNKSDQGESELQHGKASIGRTIENQVTGIGIVSEYVKLSVPVFVGQPFRTEIEMALEPDPSNCSFLFVPLPSQVEQAVAAGEAWIGEKLMSLLRGEEGTIVPVLFGKP